MKKIILFLILIAFSTFLNSDEIIKDSNENFFILKSDGTFKKLPNPKPGHKYIIKKKMVKTKKKVGYLTVLKKNHVFEQIKVLSSYE